MNTEHLIETDHVHLTLPSFTSGNPERIAQIHAALQRPENPSPVHPQDLTLTQILHTAINSSLWTNEYHLLPEENTEAWVDRLTDDDSLDPRKLVTYDNDEHKAVALALLASTYVNFDLLTILEELLTARQSHRQKLQEAKDENQRLKEQVAALTDALSQADEGPIEYPNNQTAIISSWGGEDPIGLYVRPEPGRTALETLAALPPNWGIRERIPALAEAMATPAPATRLSFYLEEGASASDSWNRIHEQHRIGRATPTTKEQLEEAITEILSSAPPDCQHPRELANVLTVGTNPGQPWVDSLRRVQSLMIEPTPATPGQLAATGEASLFKISDVPKFAKRSEYWGYRVALERFFSSVTEPPERMFGTALNRIISSWESDDVRTAAGHWDIEPLLTYPYTNRDARGNETIIQIERNWSELKEAFLHACDDMFLELTITEDSVANLNNTRPKPGQKPADFLLDFDAAVVKRNKTARIAGTPVLSDLSITDQLLRVIPKHVRDTLRHSLAMQIPSRKPENMTLSELKPFLIYTWTYANSQQKESKPVAARTRAQPTTLAKTQGGGNQVTQRKCGLIVSYDSAPAVPMELRGGLYHSPRNTPQQNAENARRRQLAVVSRVCEFCRRPQSQHHASGPDFKMVLPARSMNDQPVQRRVQIDLPHPRIEDVTGQPSPLLLPAPENPVA